MLVVDSLGPNPLAAHHHQHTNTKSMHLEFFISLPVFLWLTLVKMLLNQMLFLFFENLPSERMKKATVRAFESLIVHLIRYFFWWILPEHRECEKKKTNSFCVRSFLSSLRIKTQEMQRNRKNQFEGVVLCTMGTTILCCINSCPYFFSASFFSIHKYVCNLINNVDAVLNRGSNYMHSLMYAAQIHIVIYVLHWLCYEWGN